MKNVEVFLESKLSAKDVFEFGADHVAIATGSYWRRDRFDGARYVSVGSETELQKILTPDDIIDGKIPYGPTLVYDEDGYYVGGSLRNGSRLKVWKLCLQPLMRWCRLGLVKHLSAGKCIPI